jgi:hypothetical protein
MDRKIKPAFIAHFKGIETLLNAPGFKDKVDLVSDEEAVKEILRYTSPLVFDVAGKTPSGVVINGKVVFLPYTAKMMFGMYDLISKKYFDLKFGEIMEHVLRVDHNFSEIKKRIDRMHRLAVEGESGELERKYTKKERVVIGREIEKLHFNFGGIKKLERIPSMMLVVDPRHDHIAVTEANDMKIPVVGIMSSDNNTRLVTYPVIVNDALQTSVSLVLAELLGAYTKGKATYVPKPTARVTSEHRRPARRPE